MTTDKLNLEICTLTEWWRECSPIDFDDFDEVDRDEACNQVCNTFWSLLQDAGYNVVPANRSLPSWQGAMYTWKGPGVACWKDTTGTQRDEIWHLLGMAFLEVRSDWGT